jgi:hypothetical protein
MSNKLSNEDKKDLVDKLPDFELSYDKIIHKKVLADTYLIIPKGKKSLVWFNYFNEKNICLVLELDNSNNINNMYIVPYCFDNELSYNTLLYGTIKIINKTTFFTCENILFYKNIDLKLYDYKTKFMYMKELFKNIKNTNYFKDNFIIGLPIIKHNYNHAVNEIQHLNYDIYGIQAIHLHEYYPIGIIKHENHEIEAIFKVMADIKADIYKLFYLDNNTFVFQGIAMIPAYKTSVFMNQLFRTIKENENLDFLEESDDEEEFENTNEDKYVDLKKSIVMKCVYMDKFRKWKPISIANKHSNIISNHELYKLNKK